MFPFSKNSSTFSSVFIKGVTVTCGHISVSISKIHWSKCRRSLALDPASVSVGTLGSGGGSGVARYLATSLAQSEYPDLYLSTAKKFIN